MKSGMSKKKENNDEVDIIDRSANIFCETTSVNIASKRSGLQPVDLQFLREKVGKPTTQVTLPSRGMVSNRVIDLSQTSQEFITMIDERNNHRRKCTNNRNDSIIDLISSPVKREHKRLKGVRNSFFLNEDGQLELVE